VFVFLGFTRCWFCFSREGKRISFNSNVLFVVTCPSQKHARSVDSLVAAVNEASKINDPEVMKAITVAESAELVNKLNETIKVGKDWSFDEDIITEGERLLRLLETGQELVSDVTALEKASPISSQTVFVDLVYRLEKSIERAQEAGMDQSQLDLALDLIARSHIEYWLNVLLERLKDVVTADDSNEHDINKLKAAIAKAQELSGVNEQLLSRGITFVGRLSAELGMSRAIKHIPVYKLPPHDGVVVEGYWGERDTGKVKETEGFPMPPESGEYEWIPSESFAALGRAIAQIKLSYDGADQLHANPAIIQEAKEKLVKAEKDYKILEAKDAADKVLAIEAVKKMAKKLKGGKKKPAKK
jgi:hypothetical protein